MRLEGEGKIGIVYGTPSCVESLKEQGFDVELTYEGVHGKVHQGR